jgi:hypothetical protein
MERLEVSGAVRPLQWPFGVKGLKFNSETNTFETFINSLGHLLKGQPTSHDRIIMKNRQKQMSVVSETLNVMLITVR